MAALLTLICCGAVRPVARRMARDGTVGNTRFANFFCLLLNSTCGLMYGVAMANYVSAVLCHRVRDRRRLTASLAAVRCESLAECGSSSLLRLHVLEACKHRRCDGGDGGMGARNSGGRCSLLHCNWALAAILVLAQGAGSRVNLHVAALVVGLAAQHGMLVVVQEGGGDT